MGKTVRLTVTRHSKAPGGYPPGVFRTRKYGDPLMVSLMGLDVNGLGTTNFQNIDLFSPAAGFGFGAVSKWQEIYQPQLDYLVGLQPTDVGPLRTKMSFLVGNKDESGVPERPYWTKGGGPWDDTWKSYRLRAGERLMYGTMVFGGQLIMVETDAAGKPVSYRYMTKYQETTSTEEVEFYRLKGLPWKDRAMYNHQNVPWFIQKATWADWGNQYVETWHGGTIYHPVWSPEDFPSNCATPLYIAKAFLVEP